MSANLNRKNIVIAAIVVFLLLVGSYWFFNHNGTVVDNFLTVNRGEFVKEVSVSGKVVATEKVDLSFSETGRVASLRVKVGDEVVRGQILASLANGTLLSDLAAAEASLAQKLAEYQNTGTNLSKVEREQNTLVANAYSKLLSNDLAAVPSSANVSVTPPTVTGLYSGAEGKYKVNIRQGEGINRDGYELLTFDLEKTGPVKILDDEATPVGTHGLFMTFPEDPEEYSDTTWYISIPNQKSESYLTAFNDYQEALRTRDREIADAGSKLNRNGDGLGVAEAEVASARAEVARVQAAISERTIFAPFSGVITAVPAELGGIASANATAISMISAGNLQIESFVPEIHIPFIKVGDPAIVTLDAYGADTLFAAKVFSIDPAETIRDGVSTYRAKLEFVEKDPRVKSGMTANVVITAEKKSDTIAIPQGAVYSRNGQKFVLVKTAAAPEERAVTTGSISSLGEIEILTGLEVGETVVIPPESSL